MEFDIDNAVAVLSRTPGVLNAMLEGMPSQWTDSKEGEDKWSPFDVVGHLIHAEETDWIPRARMILESGEESAFEPFDRFAQFEKNKGKTINDLLDTFKSLRNENIEILKNMNLSSQDLERRGKHPDLGTVTMKELLSTWVAHDLGHIIQISRSMAKQYKSEVGPWRSYLSVMND